MTTARRLPLTAAFLLALLAPLLVPATADAAEPGSGTVSGDAATVSWSGGPFATSQPVTCVTSSDPACDVFELTVEVPDGEIGTLDVAIETEDGNDLDLFLYDDQGNEVESSATPSYSESLTVEGIESGTYEVLVQAWLVTPGATYQGTAALATAAPAPDAPGSTDSILWPYDSEAAQVTAEVPLNVVMIGFESDDSLLEQQEAILGEIPTQQRPGSLYRYDHGSSGGGDDNDLFGLDTLVNHGRAYYEDRKPFLLPIEFKWQPEFHVASEQFSKDFFEVMADSTTDGRFSDDNYTAYLERYNATRGAYRVAAGGEAVAPGSEVGFVDAEKVEDWLASEINHYDGLEDVPAGKEPGEAGYTVFFINSFDGPGSEQLPQDQYHVFKIERPSPDIDGVDAGIDWARIWGGRYRFMMVDLGAAPNPYEAETWGNRRRSAVGSAAYDPPIWEYRANADRTITPVHLADGMEQAVTPGSTWDAEQFGATLGRTVNQAISFRFLHSYLYEPRPGTGRFFLSDNVWHDAKAMQPWESDLTKLYDQKAALEGLSSLTPYFEFAGDVEYQYLAEPEFADDQEAVESFKRNGDDIAGASYTAMNTATAMDYIDENPERFLRGGDCYTTVPTLQLVVEKHYAWALPVIVAGIAPNRNGVPWGFLNSVSDLTKWSGADKDPMMAAVHPDLFSGTFTYTTVHEASHYLGLAHPHDTIGATTGEDGETRYYRGFTWAFNSTAAPTTYSHEEMAYSILDQETIARGHTAYYLSWTDEVLQEVGLALLEDGIETVGELSPELVELRETAIEQSELAEEHFAAFDFIEATYAAQRAWLAASSFADQALEKEPGTTEAEYGSRNDPAIDPAACGDDGKLTGKERAEQAKAERDERRTDGHGGNGGDGNERRHDHDGHDHEHEPDSEDASEGDDEVALQVAGVRTDAGGGGGTPLALLGLLLVLVALRVRHRPGR